MKSGLIFHDGVALFALFSSAPLTRLFVELQPTVDWLAARHMSLCSIFNRCRCIMDEVPLRFREALGSLRLDRHVAMPNHPLGGSSVYRAERPNCCSRRTHNHHSRICGILVPSPVSLFFLHGPPASLLLPEELRVMHGLESLHMGPRLFNETGGFIDARGSLFTSPFSS